MADWALVKRRRIVRGPHSEPSWHRFEQRLERRYFRTSNFDEAWRPVPAGRVRKGSPLYEAIPSLVAPFVDGTIDGACRDGRRSNQVLLAAGTAEYERKELSRRAERRRMAGTQRRDQRVRLKPDTTYMTAYKTKAGSQEQDPAYDPRRV